MKHTTDLPLPYGTAIDGTTGQCSDGLVKDLRLPLLKPYLDKDADHRHRNSCELTPRRDLSIRGKLQRQGDT